MTTLPAQPPPAGCSALTRHGLATLGAILLLLNAYVLLGAMHWTMDLVGRAQFHRSLEQMRRAGHAIEPRDLPRPQVPAKINPADELTAAAEALRQDLPCWQGYRQLSRLEPPISPVDMQHGLLEALVEEQADALERIAAICDERLEREVDEEGRLRPPPPVDWNLVLQRPLGMFNTSADLAERADMAYLMQAAAHAAYRRDDHAEALAWVRRMLDYADAQDQVPFLTDHRLTTGIRSIAVTVVLASPRFRIGGDAAAATPEAVCTLILLLLDEEPATAGLRMALAGERVGQLDNFRYLFSRGGDVLPLMNTRGGGPARRGHEDAPEDFRAMDEMAARHLKRWPLVRRLSIAIGFRVLRPWLYGDVITVAQWITAIDRAFAQADSLPQFQRLRPDDLLDQFVTALDPGSWQRRFALRRYMVVADLLPSFNSAIEQEFRTRTARRLAATRLAIDWYRSEHEGQFPPTLEALVPRYLPSVPQDPMAEDAPLRYDAHRRVLWSVGEDADDDHGQGPDALLRQRPDLSRREVREQTDRVIKLK